MIENGALPRRAGRDVAGGRRPAEPRPVRPVDNRTQGCTMVPASIGAIGVKFARDFHTTSDRRIVMAEPKLSREAFDILVVRSGLPLNEAKKAELYAACGYLEKMKERVRAGGEYPRNSQSSHVSQARE